MILHKVYVENKEEYNIFLRKEGTKDEESDNNAGFQQEYGSFLFGTCVEIG